jgi:hypothetical protein
VIKRQRHKVDAQKPVRREKMIKKTAARKSTKPGNPHKAASNSRKDAFATVESLLPAGSRERTAAGIAAAAGGALLAAVLLGVGPAALAGAAGYLVYRETR